MTKKNTKVLIASLVCIMIIVLIRLINVLPTNISFVVNYDNDIEMSQTSLVMENNKSGIETNSKRVVNSQSVFAIDPQYFKLDKLELLFENVSEKSVLIKNIEINSGTEDKKLLIKNYSGDELSKYLIDNKGTISNENNNISLKESDGKAKLTFSKEFRNEFEKVIYKKSVIKLYLYALVLVVYIAYCLRILYFKKVSFLKYTGAMLAAGILILYIGNLCLNYTNASNSKDLGIITEDPVKTVALDKEYSQNFMSSFDDLSGIELFLYPSEKGETEDIYLSLLDVDSGQTITKQIIYGEEIEGNESSHRIKFEKQANSHAKSYRIILNSINEVKKFPAQIATGESSNYLVANMQSDKVQESNSIVFMPIFERFNAQATLIIIICVGVLFLLIVLNYKKLNIPAKWAIILIYLVFSIYSVYRINYYHEYVGRTPDEDAHISYLAYLEDENKFFVPDYFKIKVGVLEDKDRLVIHDEAVYNYLGHPPLYYEILHLARVVDNQGDGSYLVKDKRLLIMNIMIGMSGLLLAFYVGYSRLKKEPIYHLLYASILTSIPMLIYGFSGVNNDNLTLLTVTIFFLGMLRFSENRLNFLTYLLIALGINLTMWTKVTAGIGVILAAVIYLAYSIYKQKNVKFILCKEFFMTIPLYLITFVYFILVYKRFDTFQPALQSMDIPDFYNSVFYKTFGERMQMNFSEYIMYYFPKLFQSWTSIESHVSLSKENSWLSLEKLGSILVLILPTIYLVTKNKLKDNTMTLLKVFYSSILFTVLLQFKTSIDRFYLDGYPGTHQTRYYLCFIAVLGFICVKLLSETRDSFIERVSIEERSSSKLIANAISIFCIVFILLLLYGDFIYFLYYFKDYLVV
ncbi:hypothetical protein IGJ55_000842 [Enterococcus sp. AZ170]|uniref:hypothetical protein n=1 Tax=Enterococcus sp. AZ170 TaxID=2774747 RepID=UPI003D2FE6B5